VNIAQGQYWDQSWSPIRGCSHASPGCDHCWAERMAGRFSRKGYTEGQLADFMGARNAGLPCSIQPKIGPFHGFATKAGWAKIARGEVPFGLRVRGAR
jgi:hypothetical protein